MQLVWQDLYNIRNSRAIPMRFLDQIVKPRLLKRLSALPLTVREFLEFTLLSPAVVAECQYTYIHILDILHRWWVVDLHIDPADDSVAWIMRIDMPAIAAIRGEDTA